MSTNVRATQMAQIDAVAKEYGLSPQTLLGVYGTESAYGTNLGPSSAGALGPFQFLPKTGAEYGLNSTTIEQFGPSLVAAAKYLKSLGANSDPNSAQTAGALNAYSGGGGVSYIIHVLNNGGSSFDFFKTPVGSDISSALIGGGNTPAGNNPGNVPSDVLGSAANSVDEASPFTDVASLITWVGGNWLRILEFMGGCVLIIFGLLMFGRVAKAET